MPVKKDSTRKSTPRKKSTPKKSSTSKISREERANIKKAVDSLPALLIEHTPIEKKFLNEDPEKEILSQTVLTPQRKKTWSIDTKPLLKANPPSHTERKKRIILQIMVGIIMMFIGSLWLINIRTKFEDAHFNLGSEEKLWQSAKEDFRTAIKEPQEIKMKLKETDENVKKLEAEEQVKQALQKNLFLLTATTSSPPENTTSTPEQITTTTPSSTSITTSTLE